MIAFLFFVILARVCVVFLSFVISFSVLRVASRLLRGPFITAYHVLRVVRGVAFVVLIVHCGVLHVLRMRRFTFEF